jgi:hypothetical protein
VRGRKSVVVPVAARRTTDVDGGSLCGVGVGLYRAGSLVDSGCWVVPVIVRRTAHADEVAYMNRAQIRKWTDRSSLLSWRRHQLHYTCHGGV